MTEVCDTKEINAIGYRGGSINPNPILVVALEQSDHPMPCLERLEGCHTVHDEHTEWYGNWRRGLPEPCYSPETVAIGQLCYMTATACTTRNAMNTCLYQRRAGGVVGAAQR